ncbi:hypothetical protein JTS97_01730 [Clostridium botulinum]|nr:hypothetical protein [Clostridium botulinum]
MSISLALVPAVLTLKVVMNVKDLDNWVENSKINMPTTLKNEEEIIKTLKQAGYKINKYGNLFKTEIKGENEFIIWKKKKEYGMLYFQNMIQKK